MGTLDPAHARAVPVTGGRERRDVSDGVLDDHPRRPKLRWAGDGITPEQLFAAARPRPGAAPGSRPAPSRPGTRPAGRRRGGLPRGDPERRPRLAAAASQRQERAVVAQEVGRGPRRPRAPGRRGACGAGADRGVDRGARCRAWRGSVRRRRAARGRLPATLPNRAGGVIRPAGSSAQRERPRRGGHGRAAPAEATGIGFAGASSRWTPWCSLTPRRAA